MINLSCLSRQAIKYLDFIYVFTYFNWNILIMIISRDLVRVQGDPGPSHVTCHTSHVKWHSVHI